MSQTTDMLKALNATYEGLRERVRALDDVFVENYLPPGYQYATVPNVTTYYVFGEKRFSSGVEAVAYLQALTDEARKRLGEERPR